MTAWHFVSMRLTFRNRSFLPGFTSTVITDRASDMLAKVIVGRRILPAPCPLTVTMAQPCHSLRYCQQSMPTLDCQGAWCHRLRRLHCTMAGNPHDDSDGTCHDGAEYSASVADSEAGREHATGVASTSEVVDGILRKLSDRELNEINPSLSQVESVVSELLQRKIQPGAIVDLLSTHPSLHLRPCSLISTTELLISNGLDIGTLLGGAALLDIAEDQLAAVLSILRAGMFSDRDISLAVSHNPQLLLSDRLELSQRLEQLKALFTVSDAVKLSVSSDVLTMPWPDVQRIFDYAFHVMRVKQKQIVYANLFRQPFSTLVERHMFLLRTGLFKDYRRKDGEASINPRLDRIVGCSDDQFCSRFGFPVLEYLTFCAQFDDEEEHLESFSDDENGVDYGKTYN